MYSIDWAKNFQGFSKDYPMNLQKFTQFYDEHISDRYFTYETTSKKQPFFVIETRKNQLPHLMGLQHWNNINVTQPEKQYNNLINGQWDISFISKADNQAYKKHSGRIEFLPNLYNFLYHYQCSVRLVNREATPMFKRRKIDMILQKDGEKWVYILELRSKGPQEPTTYIPATLTEHRKKSNSLRFKSEPLEIKDVLVEKNT
ncbi:PBECR4 domain-containing protein [Oceanobacillus picturae]|uniref:PBECR4 domain-containing protein n=1 Tax=Oceanobacillus picturae TaxID=171693 RepID=UPI00363B3FBA